MNKILKIVALVATLIITTCQKSLHAETISEENSLLSTAVDQKTEQCFYAEAELEKILARPEYWNFVYSSIDRSDRITKSDTFKHLLKQYVNSLSSKERFIICHALLTDSDITKRRLLTDAMKQAHDTLVAFIIEYHLSTEELFYLCNTTPEMSDAHKLRILLTLYGKEDPLIIKNRFTSINAHFFTINLLQHCYCNFSFIPSKPIFPSIFNFYDINTLINAFYNTYDTLGHYNINLYLLILANIYNRKTLSHEEFYNFFIKTLEATKDADTAKSLALEILNTCPEFKQQLSSDQKNHIKQYTQCLLETLVERAQSTTSFHTLSPTEKHLLRHKDIAESQLKDLLATKHTKKEELKALWKKLIDYSKEEQLKGNIVFFHGQHWQWKLYADIFKELWKLRYGNLPIDDFVFLRFKKTTMSFLSRWKIKSQLGTYEDRRPNLLFTNLALFANGPGSNSAYYAANNHDQSSLSGRITTLASIKELFKEIGFEKELDYILKKRPQLIDLIQKLHDETSTFGNLLAISIPKTAVNSLVFSACIGGTYVRKHTINGKETDDLVTIADNFEQMNFNSEYCIVLGPEMLNPKKAKAWGISIKEFYHVDEATMKKRDALIKKIIWMIQQHGQQDDI